VVDVPNPCEVDWEDMVGDDRGRFCGRCGKTVTNLSVLDGDEIAGVLARGDCVSFLYREDASIIKVERGAAAFAPAAAVLLAATMAMTLGCNVGRTSGEPVPTTSATAGAAGASSQAGAAAAGSAPNGDATVINAEPVASGVAASASAEPAASCTPGSTAVTGAKQVVPSELLRRTAGVPRRRRD
jgi:hypothetical protein